MPRWLWLLTTNIDRTQFISLSRNERRWLRPFARARWARAPVSPSRVCVVYETFFLRGVGGNVYFVWVWLFGACVCVYVYEIVWNIYQMHSVCVCMFGWSVVSWHTAIRVHTRTLTNLFVFSLFFGCCCLHFVCTDSFCFCSLTHCWTPSAHQISD